ncbi:MULTISPECIES: PhnD/SsuA/transferrin family substrate-binding protein [unclassified Rhizobium]|uniref:phosphate/phosphite/phosphonate ABC transporter substrate-binding protein n=1 Tax=unclassified Rhizobium TaxID=2613769 RepID=UPI001A991C3B|nr:MULTISPECIES: PhnD/SsuA/transferrin family substrate-binding protein [unclassified Rhizobium]MBX5162816.1 PhnD/SsuA/transferrin family substrate-binding protein [Rhizobium sp. NZLR4b]MBX5168409.1 PhnD/SsuA/transferrin family substrate-binding protein [Rhizobium sp. NZLR1b]MBX5187675.1 PhnD/SsuA/transferrin family substrate-binding protein [Rhizobium sp. NZLR3b]MBX5194055.1 PhnD/SsuA/transferrin family substrate-binding protein [Rhizobium sp. NZLR10]MBX5200056.1 PhnD/SsuA/transferrin family 
MHLVSIAMYLTSPPLADATAELWSFLRHYLLQAGLTDLPEVLDQTVPYDEAWLRPDLLLSQTCGYPFARRLRGRVRLVATPVYDHPGCDGPLMRSFIVVRKDSSLRSLEDLRGTTAAINSPDSNSGSNLFRAAVAPLARDGRFFDRIIETGSHGGSIAAVLEGRADSAAIDCITYANIRRFDPGQIEGVRIIAETPKGPGLPFITSGDASDDRVLLLRNALDAAISEPSLTATRAILGLTDFAVLSEADYEPLLSLAGEALPQLRA